MAVVINGNGTVTGVTAQDELNVDSNTLVVDSTNDRVGIGTSSPSCTLQLETNGPVLRLTSISNTNASVIQLGDTDDQDVGYIRYENNGNAMRFGVNVSERMRIDSSGNLLVGKTSAASATIGAYLQPDGAIVGTRSSANPLLLNRTTSDGSIVEFRKDGSSVGTIGTYNTYLVMGHETSGLLFNGGSDVIHPWNTSTNSGRDDVIDLGYGAGRFDDIYATNGTIQTSDQNEKQQIASLTDAEMNVAKRLSALFKTYKWNSSVEENGDNARTHTGIIAQDMQQAFTDEGLDAGNYAMFISSTWWETSTDVPAVEAVDAVYETVEIPAEYDDEGNEISPATTEQRLVEEAVEAKDAYTRIDTFQTQEEAPEGATERTRLGVRYPELFAFINAYNDQRFEALETRLEALENA